MRLGMAVIVTGMGPLKGLAVEREFFGRIDTARTGNLGDGGVYDGAEGGGELRGVL